MAFKEDDVWWHEQEGPIKVRAARHWDNIERFPEIYSLARPKVVYAQPEGK